MRESVGIERGMQERRVVYADHPFRRDQNSRKRTVDSRRDNVGKLTDVGIRQLIGSTCQTRHHPWDTRYPEA